MQVEKCTVFFIYNSTYSTRGNVVTTLNLHKLIISHDFSSSNKTTKKFSDAN